MRTTITLEKDVAALIERLRRTRRQSLKHIVNEALREGLQHLIKPQLRCTPCRTESVDAGRCLVGNMDNIDEVLAIAEGDAYR